MDRFETKLAADPDVNHWSSYVGQSAVRFILSFDPQPSNPFYGQIVVVTKSIEARERLRGKINTWAREEFAGLDVYVDLLALGPPAGRPVQYRLSGLNVQEVRDLAQKLAALVSEHPRVTDIGFNWNEPARVVKVDVLQDKARQLGVTSQDIASTLKSVVGGTSITQVRDAIYLVDVVSRARAAERRSIDTLENLQLPGKNGQSVPLAAIASFHYELEQPVIWRRSRLPTITIRGSIVDATQPATVAQQLAPKVQEFVRTLPAGYNVAVGGPVEESQKSQGPIVAVVPLMLFLMATILMVQLQSFSRLFLVVAVAPLGLIGVVAAMLPSGAPMGFVAILGVLALVGILIRNSVILVVQIDDHLRDGWDQWAAVVDATTHRTRPILLTAAAASLALIPISREVFWGPMAYAMMGGIIVGTVLTLLFLPALYVAWFRVKAPSAAKAQSPSAEAVPQPA
jgi:multidrug efflux pump subunit AcrB